MSDEVCVGPAGGCPLCYRRPCICRETEGERAVRENREAKRQRVQGSMVETLDCEQCGEWAVVPDRVVRAFMCLHCGWQQKPTWTPENQRPAPREGRK